MRLSGRSEERSEVKVLLLASLGMVPRLTTAMFTSKHRAKEPHDPTRPRQNIALTPVSAHNSQTIAESVVKMPSMDFNPRMSIARNSQQPSQQKKQPDEDAFMTLVC